MPPKSKPGKALSFLNVQPVIPAFSPKKLFRSPGFSITHPGLLIKHTQNIDNNFTPSQSWDERDNLIQTKGKYSHKLTKTEY